MRYVVVGIRQLLSFVDLFRHVFAIGFRACEIHSRNEITRLFSILV